MTFEGDSLTSINLSEEDSEEASIYYIEIIKPENLAGQIIDIVSNTSNSIVTAETSLESLLDTNSVISVRKYLQLSDVFGEANEVGLTSGQDSSTSDTVRLTESNGVLNTYYFQTDSLGFLGGTGWRKEGDVSTDHATKRITPDQSVVVSRLPGGTTLTSIISGSVKMFELPTPIYSGLNAVSSPFPVDVTLGESGLYTGSSDTGLKGGANISSADVVYIYNPSDNDPSQARLEKYYYQIDDLGFLGGTGWRKDGDVLTDQSSKVISASTGVIISIDSNSSVTLPSPFANVQ